MACLRTPPEYVVVFNLCSSLVSLQHAEVEPPSVKGQGQGLGSRSVRELSLALVHLGTSQENEHD